MDTPQSSWRILVVDDKAEDAQSVADRIAGEEFGGITTECEACPSFEEALDWLGKKQYDLAIVDLVDDRKVGLFPGNKGQDQEAGEVVLELIRATRALPVIFYSAHPEKVIELVNPMIKCVDRGGDPQDLMNTISEIFDSGLPSLIREIHEIQRTYLWDFVALKGAILESDSKNGGLSMLLARRLGYMLREKTRLADSRDSVSSMEYYIHPEPEGSLRSGGIVHDGEQYWLLLTPSCDLEPKNGRLKADWILMARCTEITQHAIVTEWMEKQDSKNHKANVRRLLQGNAPQSDRGFYLPAAYGIPHLFADFQRTATIPHSDFGGQFRRVATLDSPFAEAALARFARYFGRLGTPNLDLDAIITQLHTTRQKSSA